MCWWARYVGELDVVLKVVNLKSALISTVFTGRLALNRAVFLARQPPVGHGLLIHEVSGSHTTAHHSR